MVFFLSRRNKQRIEAEEEFQLSRSFIQSLEISRSIKFEPVASESPS